VVELPGAKGEGVRPKAFGKYIVSRYTLQVSATVTTAEYRALSELRHRIRRFLREGDAQARAGGLEPQQYLLLLALRGLPSEQDATIRSLAERLVLKHHSAVELVDRLAARGYVRRTRSRDDRRKVFVSLLPRGTKLVERVARRRISELRASGAQLVVAIEALLQAPRTGRARPAAATISSKLRPAKLQKAKILR
jgi:DNA-binding MarR family transcriptional regulator